MQRSARAEAAERYASAVCDLAQAEGGTASLAASAASLTKAFDDSEELRRVLAAGIVSIDDKGQALQALARRLGAPELVVRFLQVLASNGRAELLPDVLVAIKRKLAEMGNVVVARVETATPMTASQRDKLMATLEKSLGRSVEIDAHVSPGLVGGLIVQIGSRQLDASVRTKLHSVNSAMKGA